MRRNASARVSLGLCAMLLCGCAVSSATFYKSRSTVSDLQLCRTVNSSAAKAEPQFRQDVARELVARGYTRELCQQLIDQENAKIASALGAAATVAASSYAAGSGYNSGYNPVPTDYSWEWDEFYNEYYQLIWRCRGVQTGQFAEDSRCQWKSKTDWKWPSKAAPR